MKKILFLLGFLFVNFSVYATTDDGFEAQFIGFMGKNQEYALIYEANIQGEPDGGSLYAIQMTSAENIKKDVVNLMSQNNSNSEAVDAFMKNFESPEKIWKYYLKHIKPNAIYSQKFTNAKDVKLINSLELRGMNLQFLNQGSDFEKSCHIKSFQEEVVSLPLSYDNALVLKSKVLKTYDSFKVTGQNCYVGDDEISCSSCREIKIKTHGIQKTLLSCKDEVGQLMSDGIKYDGTVIKKGAPCQCHEKAFVMALELSSKKARVMGPAYLADEFVYDQKGPPEIYSAGIYQNQNGDILVVATLAHTPRLNGSFYAASVVLPKALR